MARPKKNGSYLNIKLDTETYRRLAIMSEVSGMTKTVITERALQAYMEDYEHKHETLQRIADGTAKIVLTDEH